VFLAAKVDTVIPLVAEDITVDEGLRSPISPGSGAVVISTTRSRVFSMWPPLLLTGAP
jgi:hypothetical protein